MALSNIGSIASSSLITNTQLAANSKGGTVFSIGASNGANHVKYNTGSVTPITQNVRSFQATYSALERANINRGDTVIIYQNTWFDNKTSYSTLNGRVYSSAKAHSILIGYAQQKGANVVFVPNQADRTYNSQISELQQSINQGSVDPNALRTVNVNTGNTHYGQGVYNRIQNEAENFSSGTSSMNNSGNNYQSSSSGSSGYSPGGSSTATTTGNSGGSSIGVPVSDGNGGSITDWGNGVTVTTSPDGKVNVNVADNTLFDAKHLSSLQKGFAQQLESLGTDEAKTKALFAQSDFLTENMKKNEGFRNQFLSMLQSNPELKKEYMSYFRCNGSTTDDETKSGSDINQPSPASSQLFQERSSPTNTVQSPSGKTFEIPTISSPNEICATSPKNSALSPGSHSLITTPDGKSAYKNGRRLTHAKDAPLNGLAALGCPTNPIDLSGSAEMSNDPEKPPKTVAKGKIDAPSICDEIIALENQPMGQPGASGPKSAPTIATSTANINESNPMARVFVDQAFSGGFGGLLSKMGSISNFGGLKSLFSGLSGGGGGGGGSASTQAFSGSGQESTTELITNQNEIASIFSGSSITEFLFPSLYEGYNFFIDGGPSLVYTKNLITYIKDIVSVGSSLSLLKVFAIMYYGNLELLSSIPTDDLTKDIYNKFILKCVELGLQLSGNSEFTPESITEVCKFAMKHATGFEFPFVNVESDNTPLLAKSLSESREEIINAIHRELGALIENDNGFYQKRVFSYFLFANPLGGETIDNSTELTAYYAKWSDYLRTVGNIRAGTQYTTTQYIDASIKAIELAFGDAI